MWVLETDLGFSGRAIHILNPGASPELLFLYFCLSKGVFCLWPSSDFSTDVFRLSTLHFKMEAVTSSCISQHFRLTAVFLCLCTSFLNLTWYKTNSMCYSKWLLKDRKPTELIIIPNGKRQPKLQDIKEFQASLLQQQCRISWEIWGFS